MQTIRFLALALVALPSAACQRSQSSAVPAAAQAQFVYPETRKVDVVETYHGVEVADPYRWLEDDNAAETAEWVKVQNALTFGYLESLPARERLQQRLTELWNYERYRTPWKRGGRYFYFRNEGLQNQSVLYTSNGLDAPARILLDPNVWADDGTVALNGVSVSWDGKYLAYGMANSGSDWVEWHVRDIETGKDTTDHIRWTKFTAASWTHDNAGFFYGRYDEPASNETMQATNYFHKLYYHRLGTPQAEDTLIHERPDNKEWAFANEVSEDGRFLIISVHKGTGPDNLVLLKDLRAGLGAPIETLINTFEAEFKFVGNQDQRLWFKTTLKAPNGRVVAIDVDNAARDRWTEVLPEVEYALSAVDLIGGKLIARYIRDAHTYVRVFSPSGQPSFDIELPGIGSAWGFHGEQEDPETFYVYTSFTTPPSIYHLNLDTEKSRLYRSPKVAFNPDDFETRQVSFHSRDGTRVPMFITQKRGRSGAMSRPTFLYGYGGFGISMTPWFSVANLVWLELGGIFAVPNIRGGAEYGEAWHQAGIKLKKQAVFDDFIAAAEWLVANGYTVPSKLAIGGSSNGGLLVGATMTQRPELFGVALPDVGVLDMLRFHKFTIGWAWADDYGSSDDAKEFAALYAYSPLHNLRPGAAYPATLVTTADHDDRVVPAHSFKFAAALQAAQGGRSPALIRIETKAGHGAGTPVSKRIEEVADQWAFAMHNLAVQDTAMAQFVDGSSEASAFTKVD